MTDGLDASVIASRFCQRGTLFPAHGAACYPPRPMSDIPAPQPPPPIWWRFAVSITCTVTLLLAVAGVAHALATF
jgi:hypothetical protein